MYMPLGMYTTATVQRPRTFILMGRYIGNVLVLLLLTNKDIIVNIRCIFHSTNTTYLLKFVLPYGLILVKLIAAYQQMVDNINNSK